MGTKLKTMTQEQKISFIRIALAMQGIGVTNETADRIVQTYEKVLEKGGKFSVEDAVMVEYSLDKKYRKKDIEVRAEKSEDGNQEK
jgi:hypothetical protein